MNQELDIQKTGAFLSALRKERQFTQKNLGDMLGVTNKAVSKWERGISFPDISLLPQIAEIFGVTIEELMIGKHKSSPSPYQDETSKPIPLFNMKKKKILFFSLSILALLTCFFSLLINIITNRDSVDIFYLAGIIIALLLSSIPIIFNHKHMVEKSFIIFISLSIIYVYIFLYLEKASNMFLSLALPIVLISCLTIYVICKSFLHHRKNLFYAFSFSLIAISIGPIILINLVIVSNGIERYDDISQSIILPLLFTLSIFLLICGYLKNKNIEETQANSRAD
ncbi:MAG: helix-turn-helix domain-containing protein [Lachnospiraceae bacterium]|nr:helix-turn-helix domain-containing protein [Lachnospiraceae bacterium]